MADDATSTDPATFWDDRYGGRDQLWTGEPNHALVEVVGGWSPGRALDLGCGEGGDSVWLAEQGWQVTGVDVSAVAVDRARAAAARRQVPAHRLRFVVTDLAAWRPEGPVDLVSACFLLSPLDFPRAEVLRRAAGALVPGGHLLVVGHAEAPPWAEGHHDRRFPTAEEDRADLGLDDAEWETLLCEARPRRAKGPDGQVATLDDTVVLLRRRARPA